MFERPSSLTWAYLDLIRPSRRADRCINCGNCSKICPQKIDVPEQLDMVHERALLLTLLNQNESYDTLLEENKNKTIVLFGAGNFGRSMIKYARKRALPIKYICDNGSHLWGTEIEGIMVISPDKLKEVYNNESTWILITNQYSPAAIKEQLISMGMKPAN
jgi:ferredoxin